MTFDSSQSFFLARRAMASSIFLNRSSEGRSGVVARFRGVVFVDEPV